MIFVYVLPREGIISTLWCRILSSENNYFVIWIITVISISTKYPTFIEVDLFKYKLRNHVYHSIMV